MMRRGRKVSSHGPSRVSVPSGTGKKPTLACEECATKTGTYSGDVDTRGVFGSGPFCYIVRRTIFHTGWRIAVCRRQASGEPSCRCPASAAQSAWTAPMSHAPRCGRTPCAANARAHSSLAWSSRHSERTVDLRRSTIHGESAMCGIVRIHGSPALGGNAGSAGSIGFR